MNIPPQRESIKDRKAVRQAGRVPARNAIRGIDVQLEKYAQPPFRFQGVVGRVFPLKADLQSLQRFCNSHLNDLLAGKGSMFRPSLPYVLVAVLYYDKMNPERQPQDDLFRRATARGSSQSWVSQNEVAFIVPVEWYREEYGRWVFHDWAYLVPFIFVDDDYSLTLGREVYGWPKLAASIRTERGAWVPQSQSRSRLRVMTLRSTQIPQAKISQAEKAKLRKVLAVDIEASPSFSQLRPDPNPLALLLDGPQMLLESWAMMYNWFEGIAGLSLLGNRPPSDQQVQASKVAQGLRGLGSLWSDLPREQSVSALLPGFSYQRVQEVLSQGLSREERARVEQERQRVKGQRPENKLIFNHVTLKQFPDTEHPEGQACYQAIVKSPMEITRYHNGGLLGDTRLLQGDPTGGFRIQLYYRDHDESDLGWQVFHQLGIDPARQPQPADGQDGMVATLVPLYPFWFEGDLLYGKGEKVWRRVKGRTQYFA
jgi:hypothetical protein